MRVARSHETLDDRRQVVIDLLDFIRDFNQLDTTLLIEKVHTSQTFLEAAEAVLLSAVGPWKSMDALRDFCVQALSGEKSPIQGLADRIRPRDRVTPFSVPFALLRAMAPRGQFDPYQLKSLSMAEAIDTNGLAGEEQYWNLMVTQSEAWLVTSMWSRVIPGGRLHADVQVTDQGSMRSLHRGKLWALTADAVPCFWYLPPNSPLEIRLSRQREDQPATVMFVIEGWRYLLG